MPITQARNHNGITVTTTKETAYTSEENGANPVGWRFKATTNDVRVYFGGETTEYITIIAGEDWQPYWTLRGDVQSMEFEAVGGSATFYALSMGS